MGTARFPANGTTYEEAVHYLTQRAVQSLMDGFRPEHPLQRLVEEGVEWGVRGTAIAADGARYQSVYVYAQGRGQGRLSRYVRRDPTPFVTAPGCDIEAYFAAHGVPYVLAGEFTLTAEYRVIEAFYGDTHARRSGVYYMNHIDEGLAVLRKLGASDRARCAWCLHPLVQGNEDLASTYARADLEAVSPDAYVLLLAMEYRNIANAYLSRRRIESIEEIALSPLEEVNDLLRADKVQNYKDFLLHHGATHPRRAELDRYFRSWLRRLGISRAEFAELFRELQVVADPAPLPEVEAW